MLSGAQTWTVLGGVFGVIAAVRTITVAGVTSQQPGLRAEFNAGFAGLRAEMGAQRVELVSEIAQLRSETLGFRSETLLRFDQVDRRFDQVDRRLNGLDRDMQAVTSRVFRSGPETG